MHLFASLAVLLASILAPVPPRAPVTFGDEDCTDFMCWAQDTVVDGCGESLPIISVLWAPEAFSGECNANCAGSCRAKANVTMIARAGTFLNGGGQSCNALGFLQADVQACGGFSAFEINVHTASPCTAANEECTFTVVIGCTNCE